ncbi:MAG TPA: (d)CMP kinase [Egibacteraceae bacterium]|nr:(d)CMP kinase [Egibacteraceae bacterium]
MTVIAIDGPAGSGKSTIAAALAERLGVAHVDTGAYYRAATLAVLRAGVSPDDVDAALSAIAAATIDRRNGRTCLDGADVEDEIRGRAVTATVSSVSRHPAIRKFLVELQRREVAERGAVVEGRDAGTVVVPDADLKVWLTASTQERARRRAAQHGDASDAAVARQSADIARRDAQDATQMTPATDAVEVDTTGCTIDEVLDAVVAHLDAAPSGRP